MRNADSTSSSFVALVLPCPAKIGAPEFARKPSNLTSISISYLFWAFRSHEGYFPEEGKTTGKGDGPSLTADCRKTLKSVSELLWLLLFLPFTFDFLCFGLWFANYFSSSALPSGMQPSSQRCLSCEWRVDKRDALRTIAMSFISKASADRIRRNLH